jgi:hypothetical protein
MNAPVLLDRSLLAAALLLQVLSEVPLDGLVNGDVALDPGSWRRGGTNLCDEFR